MRISIIVSASVACGRSRVCNSFSTGVWSIGPESRFYSLVFLGLLFSNPLNVPASPYSMYVLLVVLKHSIPNYSTTIYNSLAH